MTTPKSIASTLPDTTIAEVRERLAAGEPESFIRADAAARARGLPGLDHRELASAGQVIADAAIVRMVDKASGLVAHDIRQRRDAFRELAERRPPLTREDVERMLAPIEIPSPAQREAYLGPIIEEGLRRYDERVRGASREPTEGEVKP